MRNIIDTSYSRVQINEINKLAMKAPKSLVRRSEEYYNFQVMAVASAIAKSVPKYKFILLCGPSASGKTTTAHKLSEQLVRLGVQASVISMDNFFTGMENYPLLEDGSPDMESIQAVDMDLLNNCFEELLGTGRAMFPEFDFTTQRQKPACHPMTLSENGVVIMEGIHALNPVVLSGIDSDRVFRIYVSVRTKFMEGEETILKPKDIRLTRRIVRDYKFRNYHPMENLTYWKHVVAAEKVNIDPYRDNVDIKMDNTIDYEVGVWRNVLHHLLESLAFGDYAAYPELEKIFNGLKHFPEVNYGLIPRNSLLREFIGND